MKSLNALSLCDGMSCGHMIIITGMILMKLVTFGKKKEQDFKGVPEKYIKI